jgi:hypothetical protein
MTDYFRYQFIDNLPQVPCKAYEYTVTVSTAAVNGRGEKNDRVVIYATPIAKGDEVVVYDDSNSNGEIVVSKFLTGNDVDRAHGRAIDDPKGADNSTANGGTPTHAKRRTVTVAFYGDAVMDFVADGTITAGYGMGFKESGASATLTAITSTPTAGAMIALAHQTTGNYFPVLLGFSGYAATD